MMRIRHIISILIFIKVSYCYAFINQRICDPSTRQLLPYSGIRFYKKNQINLATKINSNIFIIICSNGEKVIDVKDQLTHKDININWNSTICFKNNEMNNNEVSSSSWYNNLVNTKRSYSIKDSVNYEMYGANINTHYNSSYIDLNSDIKCFKIVRSKKYYNRILSIFSPHSLIGGLFQCQLSSSTYDNLNLSFNDNTDHRPLSIIEIKNFNCNKNAPISPLYAENLSYQFFSISLVPNILANYEIPFLYTPNINKWMPFKFKSKDDWSKGFDINEYYDDNSNDGSSISKTVTRALNKLDKLLTKNFNPKNLVIKKLMKNFIEKIQNDNQKLSAKKENKIKKILESDEFFGKLYHQSSILEKFALIAFGLNRKNIFGVDLLDDLLKD